RRRGHTAEQFRLADRGVLMRALRGGKDGVDGRKGARPVLLDHVKRAGGDQALQHPLVDGARIDAAREIRKIAEGARGAGDDDALDRLATDAAQGGKRVVNGASLDVE